MVNARILLLGGTGVLLTITVIDGGNCEWVMVGLTEIGIEIVIMFVASQKVLRVLVSIWNRKMHLFWEDAWLDLVWHKKIPAFAGMTEKKCHPALDAGSSKQSVIPAEEPESS